MESSSQLDSDPDRLVQMKAEYLADAIGALMDLTAMIDSDPATYRKCKPNADIKQTITELAWLCSVFDHAIEKGTLDQALLTKPWLNSGSRTDGGMFKGQLERIYNEVASIGGEFQLGGRHEAIKRFLDIAVIGIGGVMQEVERIEAEKELGGN